MSQLVFKRGNPDITIYIVKDLTMNAHKDKQADMQACRETDRTPEGRGGGGWGGGGGGGGWGGKIMLVSYSCPLRTDAITEE